MLFRTHGAVDVDRELKYLSNVMGALVKAISTGGLVVRMPLMF
jgi:hypothetical protein